MGGFVDGLVAGGFDLIFNRLHVMLQTFIPQREKLLIQTTSDRGDWFGLEADLSKTHMLAFI